MRTWIVLLLSTAFSTQLRAEANYALINDLLGTYSLLEANGSWTVGGTLQIQANDSGVGYVVMPLPMAAIPAPSFSSVTSKASTSLVRVSGELTQTYSDATSSIKTIYTIATGYISINTQSCQGSACQTNTFTLTRGSAPGDSMAPRDFFSLIQGDYTVVSAGGSPPAEINTGASVNLDSSPGISTIWAPYCWPTGVCDPGEIDIAYATTQVLHKNLSANDDLYTILYQNGSTLEHFSWEIAGAHSTLRNFQYNFNGKTVCLEHVFTKS
jgi:hypothetical protein